MLDDGYVPMPFVCDRDLIVDDRSSLRVFGTHESERGVKISRLPARGDPRACVDQVLVY